MLHRLVMERWAGDKLLDMMYREMTAGPEVDFGKLAMTIIAARQAVMDLLALPKNYIEYLEQLEEDNAADR